MVFSCLLNAGWPGKVRGGGGFLTVSFISARDFVRKI